MLRAQHPAYQQQCTEHCQLFAHQHPACQCPVNGPSRSLFGHLLFGSSLVVLAEKTRGRAGARVTVGAAPNFASLLEPAA